MCAAASFTVLCLTCCPHQSFDDDGSGTLDAGEILAAFRALQAQQKAAVAGGIPIATFPEKVQEKLRLFDDTGDDLDVPDFLK